MRRWSASMIVHARTTRKSASRSSRGWSTIDMRVPGGRVKLAVQRTRRRAARSASSTRAARASPGAWSEKAPTSKVYASSGVSFAKAALPSIAFFASSLNAGFSKS